MWIGIKNRNNRMPLTRRPLLSPSQARVCSPNSIVDSTASVWHREIRAEIFCVLKLIIIVENKHNNRAKIIHKSDLSRKNWNRESRSLWSSSASSLTRSSLALPPKTCIICWTGLWWWWRTRRKKLKKKKKKLQERVIKQKKSDSNDFEEHTKNTKKMRSEELTLLLVDGHHEGRREKHKQKEQKECLITFYFFFSSISSPPCPCPVIVCVVFVRKRGDISERNSSIIYTFGLNWSSHHKKFSRTPFGIA